MKFFFSSRFFLKGVEEYVHRIGRTGRGENSHGKAITFFTQENSDSARALVNMLEWVHTCVQFFVFFSFYAWFSFLQLYITCIYIYWFLSRSLLFLSLNIYCFIYVHWRLLRNQIIILLYIFYLLLKHCTLFDKILIQKIY